MSTAIENFLKIKKWNKIECKTCWSSRTLGRLYMTGDHWKITCHLFNSVKIYGKLSDSSVYLFTVCRDTSTKNFLWQCKSASYLTLEVIRYCISKKKKENQTM